MRIIIVDDRPYFMWETIKELKRMEVDTIVLLYFHGGFTYRPEKDSEIEQKCKELDTQLFHIKSNLDLRQKLNEYYEKDTLIFADYNLGDTDEFEDRVNIIYAKEKMQKEELNIWFYTTLGEKIVDRLNRTFDRHTIPLVEYIPQEYILKLDYDYIRDGLLAGNKR